MPAEAVHTESLTNGEEGPMKKSVRDLQVPDNADLTT
jgi:hypothetical protein